MKAGRIAASGKVCPFFPTCRDERRTAPAGYQGHWMRRMRIAWSTLAASFLAAAGCCAPGAVGPQEPPSPPPAAGVFTPQATPPASGAADIPVLAAPQSDNRPLPINLPTALHLANVRAVDIEAAGA